MFETHKSIFDSQVIGDAASASAELRELAWSDLGARIAAAHEFRIVLRERRQAGASSFACLSAGHLRTDMESGEEGKRPVNPVDLEQRKSSSRKEAEGDDAAMKSTERVS